MEVVGWLEDRVSDDQVSLFSMILRGVQHGVFHASWILKVIAFSWSDSCRRRLDGRANVPDTTPPTVPVVKPVLLDSRTGSTSPRATWLGHACYYIEFPNGLRVNTAPRQPMTLIAEKRLYRSCSIRYSKTGVLLSRGWVQNDIQVMLLYKATLR